MRRVEIESFSIAWLAAYNRGNIKGEERNRFVDSIPPRMHTRGMRHQRAHYGSIAWGAGKDEPCTPLVALVGIFSARSGQTRQITTLCKFVSFSFSFSSLSLSLNRADSPREKKRTGFFSAGTGLVPNMADLSKDARLGGEICCDPFNFFGKERKILYWNRNDVNR